MYRLDGWPAYTVCSTWMAAVKVMDRCRS